MIPGPGAQDEGPSGSLSARIAERWRAKGWGGEGTRVVIACSGGLDSLVLLHLFRFGLDGLGLVVQAAHFDHRMRAESEADAAWLGALAESWGIRLHLERATHSPRDESAARALRYEFLEGLIRHGAADRVLTAHHADDQVETVLFRILRGTGIEGLAGIPEERAPGILRPLLPFRRAELEEYAHSHAIEPREDSTNLSPRFARNRVRHTLLPLLEEVHPGARAGILRLARNAAEAAETLDTLLEPRLAAIVEPPRAEAPDPDHLAIRSESGGTGVVLDRERFLAEEDVIQSALLRKLARSFGFALSRSGTAVALQFMREGASGAGVAVEGKLDISRDFGALRLAPRPGGSPDAGGPTSTAPEELTIPSDAPGEGRLAVGGATLEVSWGRGPVEAFREWEYVVLDRMALHYPLTLRGWRDGDRTRTRGGGKKLKKLFGELKLTRRERSRIAVLADAAGDVLWIPGHHRAPGSVPPVAGGPQDPFLIGVRDAYEP